MKRVLFGIMALSVATFAANPGTGTATTEGKASVPVKVRAEIVKPSAGLTITDEAGTVLDELLIDHGRIVKGTASDDSVKDKIFKVKMGREDETYVAMAGDLRVSLDKTSTSLTNALATTSAPTLTSTLSLVGGSGTPVTKLESAAYVAKINGTEHIGRVNSVIPRDQLNATGLEEGIYNNGLDRPTLTVVYTPN